MAYSRHVIDHLYLIGIHVFHVHDRHLLQRDYFRLQVLFLMVIASITKIIKVVPCISVIIDVRLFIGTWLLLFMLVVH